MDRLWAEMQQVMRRFGRTPGFTLIAVITVAAALGANTAVFSIVEAVILRPLPYPQSDRLVSLWHAAPGLNLPKVGMSLGPTRSSREITCTQPGKFHRFYDSISWRRATSTIGTKFVAGRDFTWDEIYREVPVVIVSEGAAREYWQSASNALGKEIRTNAKDDWRQVVGVVGDIYSDGPSLTPPATVYWPPLMKNFEGNAWRMRRDLRISIRTPRAGSQALMKEVDQAVWAVDGNLPVTYVRTLDRLYAGSMARTSFTLAMLVIAGGMALLLGGIGLYGVVAYSVSQRTREIGIRMALGAHRNAVTRMFVRRGLALAAVGLVVGLAAAAAAGRLMSSLLFGVTSTDPMTYLLASASLAVAAALASYVPSRRAAAVDPMEALRSE